jgi:3alpha(or 20beta)-hydroxysteroid dehydrogenase
MGALVERQRGGGRLQDKVAVVSGAARGQGAAIASLFAREGATVVLGDVLDAEARATAESIGYAATWRHLDVTRESDWAGLVAWCVEEHGGIDVLVNNAGIVAVGTLMSTTLEDYRRVIEVNQVGCFLGMRAVVPPMQRRTGGSIVNTSSVAGLHGVEGVIAYSASKYAIRGMSRSAALELGADGIRVNSVHPGTIDTPMINIPEFAGVDRSAFAKTLPAGRIGESEDVARLMLFLASDESAYCTGAEFVVDGGASCGSRT